MSILLAVGFGYYALATIFVIVCILLVLMVVITPSSEGGMAAAFGGMGSDSFFGTKAHQQINKFTIFLAVSFLVLAIGLNWIKASEVQTKQEQKSSTDPLKPKTKFEQDVEKKLPPPSPSGLPDPSTLPPPPKK